MQLENCDSLFKQKKELDYYSILPHILLEIRGRGVSFSAFDYEILYIWKKLQIPIGLIIEIATQIADECATENRPFPATLTSLDRRIRNHMRRTNEG